MFDPQLIRLAGTSVFESDGEEALALAKHRLSEEGIQSAIFNPTAKFGLRLPQPRVAPDDEAKAHAILARPIDDESLKRFQELEETVIPLPGCNHCS